MGRCGNGVAHGGMAEGGISHAARRRELADPEDTAITATHDFVSYKCPWAQAAVLRTARGRFHSILNRAGSRSRGHDSAERVAHLTVHGPGGLGGGER